MITSVKGMVKGSLYVVIAVLALNAIRLIIPQIRAQSVSAVPAGAVVVPYTVALTETVIDGAGRRIPAPSQTLAVRSDGAKLTKIGDGDRSSRQIRFPSGIRVEVSDVLRGKSTIQRPIQGSWVLDPGENCTKTVIGGVVTTGQITKGEERIAGYRAVKITSGSTTRWFALDHGCAPLRRIIDFGSQGSSHLELVTLIPGEPSEALFQIPGDYKEGAPSTFASPPSEKCSAACQESRKAHFERIDRTYHKYRVP